MKKNSTVTDREVVLTDDQMIVTKTNIHGIINYANPAFIEVSGYSAEELIGAPHNIVRHPDMPPAVFTHLWQTLKAGRPWVGIVKNRCKNGDFYWVEANVSPIYQGEVLVGYLSVRYKPEPWQVTSALRYYRTLSQPATFPGTFLSFLLLPTKTALRRSSRVLSWLALSSLLGIAGLAAWQHHLPAFLAALLAGVLLNYRISFYHPASLTRREALNALQSLAQGNFRCPVGRVDEKAGDTEGEILDAIKSVQILLGFNLAETQRVLGELQEAITERDLADQQRLEQRWFTELLETTLNEFALVSMTDTKGTIIYANARFCKVSGFTQDELVGQDHSIVNSHYHDADFFRDLWQTISQGKIWRGELRNRRKDGSYYWVDSVIRPACRTGNTPDYYVSVRREITQDVENRMMLVQGKAKAETKLLEKQLLLATIVENIGSAVYMKSPDMKYLYVNTQYASRYGLKPSQMLGHTHQALAVELGIPGQDELDEKFFAAGHKTEGMESIQRVDNPAEEQHFWNIRIPLKQEDDSRYDLLGISTDMTEMKRLEDSRIEYAEKTIRVKTEFMANISHEIRTPMNSVLSVAELLRDDPLTEKQSGYLDILHFSCQHVLCLINDMLELSRIESGQWSMDQSAFSLPNMVKGVVKGLTRLALNKGLSLELVLSDKIPEVFIGSPLRLSQILTNLVGNAIKFTATGGVIVSVQPTSGGGYENDSGKMSLHFAVSDTGVGIAPEHQERIFKAFEQIQANGIEGTGLGLAISSSLVYLMGGQLKLDSTPGQGSTFYFDLNLPLGAGVDGRLLPATASAISMAGKKILLVEDNKINRELALARLQKMDCQVISAEDGQKALDVLAREQVDLILMDMRMPVLDGPSATRLYRLREAESGQARTPIIALTANAHDDDIRTCLEAGMDGHIPKPFTLDRLLEGIAAVYSGLPATATVAEVIEVSGQDFHEQMALDMFDGDKTLLQDIMSQFIEQYPLLLDRILTATRENNGRTGQEAAHTLKGNTSYLCAHPLKEQAEHLEFLFRRGDFDAIKTHLPAFEQSGKRLIAALKSALEAAPPQG